MAEKKQKKTKWVCPLSWVAQMRAAVVQCYQWLLVSRTGMSSVVKGDKKKKTDLGEKVLVKVYTVMFVKIKFTFLQLTHK